MDNTHTYKAIVLSAIDYKENDRLVRLLTPDEGIITAVMKGVKKSTSKLRFGAVPFAFCEYTIHKNGIYSTVVGCSQIESFFEISADFDAYTVGCMLLEVADAGTGSAVSAEIFIELLKSLKMLLYSDVYPYLIAVSFIQKTIHSQGYSYVYPLPPKEIVTVIDLLSLTNREELTALVSYDIPVELVQKTLTKLIANFENKFEREIRAKKLLDF